MQTSQEHPYVYYLSLEHPTIPEWEIKEYFELNITQYTCKENLLFTNKLFKGFAYTKKVGLLIADCKKSKIKEELKKLQPKGSFSLRIPHEKKLEQELAEIIYNSLKNPKVDLKNPKNPYEIWFTKSHAYIITLLHENLDKPHLRAAHNRAFPHPSSLHPKLARALVNMIGPKKKITDPFCGAAGILIEAGLQKHAFEGFDIDPLQIERAKGNLKQFNLPQNVKVRDALKQKSYNYVVTDLPYGKNTGKNVKVQELTNAFLKKEFKKAIIGLPFEIKPIKKPRAEFIIYVHKSMKRKYLLY